MAIKKLQITLPNFKQGFHLITDEILSQIKIPQDEGIIHLMLQHTSAGLMINENADPTVRDDFHSFFQKLVPENLPLYTHTAEGPDDMPAHIKSSLVGHEITIPIAEGKLQLGTWQGIYLCEFRTNFPARKIIATIMT